MKTLENFLLENGACKEGFDFAKDLTLEQFLKTCPRGDWILWLFAKTNPASLQQLTLAKGHCANTVRHLMQDKRSIAAVDVAIAFGEGKATMEELDAAASAAASASDAAASDAAAYAYAYAASSASADAYSASDAAAYAAYAAYFAAYAAYAAAAAAYAAYAAYAASDGTARKANQKLTADVCRQFLPLSIWNQID